MATGLYIDARQLQKGAKGFERLIKEFPNEISDVLNASALDIERNAKANAPTDRGMLRQTISADISKPLTKHITANAPYAAYVEFGTGQYAAQEVAKLPPDYKTYASRFKGGGKISIKGLLFILMDWFKRHGIKDRQHQYNIARRIFLKGIHPHPYMIPAVINQQKVIVRDMLTLLNKLKVV